MTETMQEISVAPAVDSKAVGFQKLNLSPEMLASVQHLGFESPSPIQEAAIPVIQDGIDVVGQSQTGSGKTAAFCIPIIEKISTKQRKPQALILTPTRELAKQVGNEVHKFGKYKKKLKTAVIFGGVSFRDQLRDIRGGAQVIIATPGRLLDHIEQSTIDLSTIETLVLDEADRMLDMGFRDDVEKILRKSSAERQTIFFSATISRSIKTLVEEFSTQPRYITVEQNSSQQAPLVTEKGFKVRHQMKFDALLRILRYYDAQSGVIFCNTQQMVEKLADDLASNDCIVDRLHGGMAQAQRERVMANFRKSRFNYLVATDVAARGIDVNELGVVVNYDLPKDPEDYVHRIGRTGRAGKKGLALSLVTGAGMRSVSQIERFTGSRLTIDALPSQSAIRTLQGEKLLESFRVDLKKSAFTTEKELLQRLFDEGYSAEDVAAAVLHRMLPKHDATDTVLDDEPDDRNHKRRKRRERPNARRDSRKKRRPEIQRAGGKRPPKKRKFQVKVQK